MGNRTAAIYAEQHTESQFIRPVMHSLASLGVDDHPIHLKILASGQQLRCHALPIFQNTQRLFRLRAAVKICNIQCLVDMQLTLFTVFADAVIIVQAIGQVGALLRPETTV